MFWRGGGGRGTTLFNSVLDFNRKKVGVFFFFYPILEDSMTLLKETLPLHACLVLVLPSMCKAVPATVTSELLMNSSLWWGHIEYSSWPSNRFSSFCLSKLSCSWDLSTVLVPWVQVEKQSPIYIIITFLIQYIYIFKKDTQQNLERKGKTKTRRMEGVKGRGRGGKGRRANEE